MYADEKYVGFDNSIDLEAYFRRLSRAGPQRPSYATLAAVVRQHIATIPFEALDVLTEKSVVITPAAIDHKLLEQHRGGYCFEHASLLRRALLAMGFKVEQHLARVCIGDARDAPAHAATHASLKVDVEGSRWLVDVGFGGFVPNVPLRWEMGTAQRTDFGLYRIVETTSGWMLEAFLEQRWTALYEILDFPWRSIDYEVANHYISTVPSSQFRQNLIVALTRRAERITLLGNRLRHVGTDGTRSEELLDAAGLERVLRDTFSLPVENAWRPALEKVVDSADRPE